MSTTRILIVEDEAIVARDLAQQLTEMGYDPIAQVASGEESIVLAGRLRPDIVLMDIQLAGTMDGITAAKNIREQFAVPVIFLTAFHLDATLDHAKQADPFGYIIKPFETRELKAAIEMALYRHQAETRFREQQEAISAILKTARDGFSLTDMAGRFLDINDAFCRLIGYSRDELLQMSISDLEVDLSQAEILEFLDNVRQSGSASADRRIRHRDGRLIDVDLRVNYLSFSGGRVFGFYRDITDRKRVEEERTASLKVLEIINSTNQLHELMKAAILLLRDWSGCESVGIRLRQDNDFPYFETSGFPAEFVKAENQLCITDDSGQPLKDSAGNPILECMCGNILCGRFDSAKPFFTPQGSFWTNSTTELLASTTEADRQARTRNRCNGEGYESVALIPLKVGNTTYGLLQANDKRRDLFTVERIALLERLGGSLAVALAHRIAQQKIAESESKFRSYVEHSPLGVAVVDRTGNYIDVNPAMVELMGYSQSELLQLRVSDMQTPEMKQNGESRFGMLLDQGKYSGKILLQKKDGTRFWCLLHSVAIGEDLFLGFHQDITEHVEMEEALRAGAAKFRAIADYTVGWESWIGEDGRLKWVNPGVEIMTGFTIEECRAMADYPLPLIAEEDRPKMAKQFETIHDESEGRSFEIRILHKNGTKRVGMVAWQPIRSETGQQMGYRASIRDITSLKNAERRIVISEAELKAIYDNVPILMCLLDEDRRVVRLNRTAAQFSERSETELIGLHGGEFLGCIHALDDPRGCGFGPDCDECPLRKAVQDTIVSGESHTLVEAKVGLTREGKLKHFCINASTARLDIEGQVRILLCITDVTARKQLEAQYLRAQRLESLGTLASGVAHDLNNVLSPLLLGGAMLEETLADDESRSVLAAMMDAVRRGSDTVRQLLTFARGGESERTLVQSNHLLKEIVRLLKQSLPKTIQIYTDSSPNLNTLIVDPSQLHQVLMNLSVNARDAMPAGGVLSITAENFTLDADLAPLLHPKAVPGAYVVFKVSDTGTGIEPEALDRIFDPFFTTKPQGQGTGLGLATVLGIVENHGGFILVDSRLGEGTGFSVYLPAASQKNEAQEPFRNPKELEGRGELVLVVDDEPSIGRLVRDVLRRHGYQALVAESAPAALELFHDNRESVRVVITDMMMPFMDGCKLIARLRAQDPLLKIVAFSGLTTDSKREEAVAAGANAFLSKPMEAAQLLTVLRDFMRPDIEQTQ
jgi:PAS domain S-box-containing protein